MQSSRNVFLQRSYTTGWFVNAHGRPKCIRHLRIGNYQFPQLPKELSHQHNLDNIWIMFARGWEPGVSSLNQFCISSHLCKWRELSNHLHYNKSSLYNGRLPRSFIINGKFSNLKLSRQSMLISHWIRIVKISNQSSGMFIRNRTTSSLPTTSPTFHKEKVLHIQWTLPWSNASFITIQLRIIASIPRESVSKKLMLILIISIIYLWF
jgi:hypothetical protein